MTPDRTPSAKLFRNKEHRILTQGIWFSIEVLLMSYEDHAATVLFHEAGLSKEECEWCYEESSWDDDEKFHKFMDDVSRKYSLPTS